MRQFVCGFIVVCIWLSVIWLVAKHKEKQTSVVQYQLLETFWMRKHRAFEERKADLLHQVEKGESMYHSYRGTTILDEDSIDLQAYEPNKKHAIVTMIGSGSDSDPYWMGAIALIQSLREVKTRVPNIVVMVRSTEHLPSFVVSIFSRLGATLMHITPSQSTWAYDSLKVWGLTNFEGVLFIDVNNMVVRNIDHLLQEKGLSAPFSAYQCDCMNTSETCRVNSNFFVCEPEAVHLQIMRASDNINHMVSNLTDFSYVGLTQTIGNELEINLNILGWKYAWPVALCVCTDAEKFVRSYQFEYWGIAMPWDNERNRFYNSEYYPSCALELYHLWYRFLAKAMNSRTLAEQY